MPDPFNTKKHYQSFIRKKNKKSVKQSEIINYQPKTFENINFVEYKINYYKIPKNFTQVISLS